MTNDMSGLLWQMKNISLRPYDKWHLSRAEDEQRFHGSCIENMSCTKKICLARFCPRKILSCMMSEILSWENIEKLLFVFFAFSFSLLEYTHWEIDPWFLLIHPESVCIYQFPVDLTESRGGFISVYILGESVHKKIFSKSCWIKPKSDYIYHFPIDFEPNGRPFGSKSIGNW